MRASAGPDLVSSCCETGLAEARWTMAVAHGAPQGWRGLRARYKRALGPGSLRVALRLHWEAAVSETAGNLRVRTPWWAGVRCADRSSGRLTVQSGRARERRVEHARPVVPGDRGALRRGEAARLERVDQPREPGGVAERRGDRRAVEVGAQPDVLDADALGHVTRVGDDRLERRV